MKDVTGKAYRAKFDGRPVASIGCTRWIETVVSAPSETDVRLKLYEKYEHITQLTVTEVRTDKGSN